MEPYSNEDDISINADAPPVPMMQNQINNTINNINNINLNKTNININPNLPNNNQINLNRNSNQINFGLNRQMQSPYLNMNRPYYLNNYQQIMMNMNNMNKMKYFNYLNQMKNNNFKNNPYMFNNKNQINFNNNNDINYNKNNNNNLYDLNIDIDSEILKKLGRNYLIDIILYMRDICKIKIPSELAGLKHEIFNVKPVRKHGKDYKFYIKAKFKRRIKLLNENKIMEKIDDLFENKEIKNINDKDNSEDENDENEGNNIINDNNSNENKINENKINNEKNNNISNVYFCDVHNKIFISKEDHEAHILTHKKCQICGMEFKYKNELKRHRKTHLINSNNINNNINNIPQEKNNIINDNEDRIKCTECNLVFDSIELMSAHFYDIHEKNKNTQIKINEEPKKLDEINEIKKEQNQKQEDIKINQEKINVNNNNKNCDEKEKMEIKKNISKNPQYKRVFKYDEDDEINIEDLIKYNPDFYPFFCALCKMGFSSEKSYKKHIKKHL